MITLKIRANITVEGASSKEEAIDVVTGYASGPEVEDVTRTGPDESPVWVINLKGEESYPKGEVDEEAPPGAESEKEEFQEL